MVIFVPEKNLYHETLLSILLAVLVCLPDQKSSDTPKKPNIVFLYTDDQTYTAVHALGNKEIITPNLGKLVKSGTTFTHTYNMGGLEWCSVSGLRAMINSGRFVWKRSK